MKIRLAKKIMKKVYKTRYWAYRFGYYHGKKDSGKIAGDHRLIKAIYKPIFGHRTTIKNQTIWMAFMK